MLRLISLACIVVCCAATCGLAQDKWADVGSPELARYFQRETETLRNAPLRDCTSFDEWNNRRAELRRQLLEMLGLDPLPARSDLKPVVTGRVERDEFVVEKLHFQSSPELYVTANLYLPRNVTEPLPAIIYVCGHGGVKENGISYGNKVHYQHHGAWFARNGFACLTLDSLQLGEIEGIHHGTYRYDRWWWVARGYTPAGVEAWNCIRALDYLATRPEIDMQRVGVSGRSGGGAYSWWIAAIDERIAAAVPVAGITDLENHVVDGVVEGHCDCMFMVNTYRLDYPAVAALVAPRPLLISNTDRDTIFPLDGVIRTHAAVRDIYELHGAAERLGLQITAGGHQDTQELRIHSFRWMNHFLRKHDQLIDTQATKFFEPAELRVFEQLPNSERNTTIDETFVPLCSELAPPTSRDEWEQRVATWRTTLAEKTFRAWPQAPIDAQVQLKWSDQHDGITISAFEFTSQPEINLPLWIVQPSGMESPESISLHVIDGQEFADFEKTLAAAFPQRFANEEPMESASSSEWLRLESGQVLAIAAPRGIGAARLPDDPAKRTQVLRRYYLLGQTLEGMQVWDVRQAIRAVRSLPLAHDVRIRVRARGAMAGVATYASLFEENLDGLELEKPTRTHHDGPYFLNVLRTMDMPHAIAMAADRTPVVLYDEREPWAPVEAVGDALQWNADRFIVRTAPTALDSSRR